MISSYEVGAIFRIVNEASPALRTILKQVRELDLAIGKARENLALVGRSTVTGLSSAVGETQALAGAWREVAAASALATRNLTGAGAAGRSAAASAAVGGGGVGGGGRHRPGWLGGGGGAHIGGPGIGIPGGSHVRFRGAGMAAAGAVGWGVYQAAETEDIVWQMTRHAGLAQNDSNHARLRKIIQDAQVRDGFDLKAVGEAALQDVRMMQGTPGGGLDMLPEMLHIAAVEARSKNSSLGESMTATVGLAHMLKAYDPETIAKMAPMFAALSTADPRSLTSIERAAGYAVPTLQAIGADPSGILLLGTALARAGVLSTKSGTWTREAVTRAMPGIVLGHGASNRAHEDALRRFGLVDENGSPTWFSDGRPDPLKMFSITGEHMQGMSPQDRARYGRAAFGAQGFGAVAVASDPQVQEQIQRLQALRRSPEFLDSYHNFSGNYQAGSTVQDARTAISQFNVTAGELARTTLPAVNIMLGNFRSILEGIRSVLPGGDGKGMATVGARVGEGAIAGGIYGALGGPGGVALGALGGAVLGGVGGVAEQYMAGQHASLDPATIKERLAAVVPPLSISFNIDGTLLGRVLSNVSTYSFEGQAPAFDGTSRFALPDHQHTSN
jgi:hypothetical protein